MIYLFQSGILYRNKKGNKILQIPRYLHYILQELPIHWVKSKKGNGDEGITILFNNNSIDFLSDKVNYESSVVTVNSSIKVDSQYIETIMLNNNKRKNLLAVAGEVTPDSVSIKPNKKGNYDFSYR